MKRRLDKIRVFFADERAVTTLEYGIVATFLCLALLGIFTSYSETVSTMYSKVTTSI